MKTVKYSLAISILFTLAFLAAPAFAETLNLTADLKGFEEVPAISTSATGDFDARLNTDDESIEYTLTYENLESNATAAHIHLGQPGVNGGIIIPLCGGEDTGQQACPERSGRVTGTVRAADVTGPAEQGISPGEFREALRAMLSGVTYANVHSQDHPEGEIRGQIEADLLTLLDESEQDNGTEDDNGGADDTGT